MILARLYLRASTDEQDATRARAALEAFAADHGLTTLRTKAARRSRAQSCSGSSPTPGQAMSYWSSRLTVCRGSIQMTGENCVIRPRHDRFAWCHPSCQ
jgi:hypothetical protein